MVGEEYDGLSEEEKMKLLTQILPQIRSYGRLSKEVKYEMANRTWKAEMEERLKRIHPQEIPMEEGRILHLPSRTILKLNEEYSAECEVWVILYHKEFKGYRGELSGYRGELSIKKDGSFDVRHEWYEPHEFPVEIWNDTERVMRELFDAAGLEITEYEQKFVKPRYAYIEKMSKGKYKIKD